MKVHDLDHPRPNSETGKKAGLAMPLKVLIVGCSAALIVVGVVVIANVVNTYRWERYVDQLRAAGQPVTFADIEARRAVIPDEQNSAKVIERLLPELDAVFRDTIDGLVLVVGESTGTLDFHNGIPRCTLQPSYEFLNRHRAVLGQLQVLREMPAGHFRIDYQKLFVQEILLPNYDPLRSGAKLVLLDATLRLLEGEMETASSDAELLFALAGTLHDEPIMLSRLVQISIEAYSIRAIENILRVGQLNGETLQRLRSVVDRRLSSRTMKWALWGERAYWIETCEQIVDGRLSIAQSAPGLTGTPGIAFLPLFLIRSNELTGARMLTSLIDALDDPRAQLVAAQEIEAALPKLSRTQVLVKFKMPGLASAMAMQIKSYAELECARCALAAEAFRQRSGRLPNSLAELVPGDLAIVPTDPFDGLPLRLAATDRGIVIYSIGKDAIDHGGAVARNANNRRPPDIGFRLLAFENRGIPLTDETVPSDK